MHRKSIQNTYYQFRNFYRSVTKMTVVDIVEELTQTCINLRHEIDSVPNIPEKEKILLQHVKKFGAKNTSINEFQKGLEWFNVSESLRTHQHLAGKICVFDFFTYCCINCMHILPDLTALEEEYSTEDGLVVIGVHSAKFANERDSNQVLAAIQRYNIAHPVVNDAKLSMWRDIGIVCWPSLVILGPEGQPLAVLVGEGHREELFLYIKVAIEHFKSLNRISSHSLPLKPAQHLLPISREILLFPGKVHIADVDQKRRIIVADTGNNRILVMDPKGNMEHVIGGYAPAFKDGNFETSRFNAPQGVCSLGNYIFVADTENHAIRKIDLLSNTVTTITGTGEQGHDYVGNKIGTKQSLSSPWDVTVYQHSQNGKTVPVLLIAMAGTHQIWALFLTKTTWWKKKEYEDGACVAIVGNGKEANRNNFYPHAASLAQPSGLALDTSRNLLFFADSESSSIRQINLDDGKVTSLCGANANPLNLHDFGDIDGKQYDAKLQHPLGVAWDASESVVYVADTYNHKIKKVDPLGNCATVYGAGKPSAKHTFNEPSGLAIHPEEAVLYVADTNNHRIVSINKKDAAIDIITVNLPLEATSVNNVYNFDADISSKNSSLKILFDVKFVSGLKLNADAPQRWSVKLPEQWAGNASTGDLGTEISLNVPEGVLPTKLDVILSIVACKDDECIPKKLHVALNMNRKSNAPSEVTVKKNLDIA